MEKLRIFCVTNKEIKHLEKLNLSLANQYGWKSKMNFSKVLDKIIEDFKDSQK